MWSLILRETEKGAVVTYLGDDITDEDAFKALKGKGLSVLVREEIRRQDKRDEQHEYVANAEHQWKGMQFENMIADGNDDQPKQNQIDRGIAE